MTKSQILIKLIESSSDIEIEVEIFRDEKKGWYIDYRGENYNINSLLDLDWMSKAEAEGRDSDTATVYCSGSVSGGSSGSYYEPPESPDVEIEDVRLYIEGEEYIDIDQEINSWNKLRSDLEDKALENANDNDGDGDKDYDNWKDSQLDKED